MLLQTILEGLGLGALLVLVCAVGIHKGAVGMAHLYDSKVQERCVALGLTTKEKIKQNSLRFKLICVPGYLAYVLICVYAVNGAQTFWGGFWQCFVILSVMNLIDRLGIDGYWAGHTKAWVIPGTEDNHGSKTLLAIVGAAPAKVVIGNSVSVVEEKAPFKPPFVAHAWHWYAPFCRFRGYHG